MFRTYFLLPLLIPLVFVKGSFAKALFRPLESGFRWLSAKPARALAVTGVTSLLACAGITAGIGIPAPQVEDEFGYLLLGDTFAHGRVTNPTPPLWQHFETVHEIMKPTYTAKYPPAQGIALAAGQLLGQPVIGVWITTALACAAMCWMLQGWMPARWALAGGLLTALHPLVLAWSQTYWGGAVAMGGGALVLGGFRRLLDDRPLARDAIVMGLGFAILANSRPYEGFVFCLLVTVTLLIWISRPGRIGLRHFCSRVAAPLGLVMALLACELGYYNWETTGDPLLMPYMLYEKTYDIYPAFLFGQERPEPEFRSREIRMLEEKFRDVFRSQRASWGSELAAAARKLEDLSEEYLWSLLLLVPLIGLPWAIRRRGPLRLAFLMGIFFLYSLVLETFVHAAPAAAVFFLLVMGSMRAVNAWRFGGRRAGRNVLRGLALLLAFSFVSTVVKMALADRTRWFYRRESILDALNREPEKSLVIVKYEPDHNPAREWVYNAADIVQAKVILARDMGPEKNKELLHYFPDRKVWVVHADSANPELEPFPGSQAVK
jgi:hypothetical protein